MPQSVPDGFPYEGPPKTAELPGRTLHGAGGSDILALKVQEKVSTMDTSISDLQSRVAALEAGTSMVGWTPIQSAFGTSGSFFDIDLTDGGRFSVGEFFHVQLLMRYDLDATGGVFARINNDQGGGNAYSWGQRALDAANPQDLNGPFPITQAALGVDVLDANSGGPSWRIGWGATVSTNNLIATFFHMNGNVLHGFQSSATRMSTSATTTVHSVHWGDLVSGLSAAPSTIRILCSTPTTFVNAWWVAMGLRLPS